MICVHREHIVLNQAQKSRWNNLCLDYR